MMRVVGRKKLLSSILFAGFVSIFLSWGSLVSASPFGQGVFGADVPFGSITSIAVNLGGNVSLALSPDSPSTLKAGAVQTITVTSTDVVGYKLYARAITTPDLVNGPNTISASGNSTPAPLSLNTWGYNTTGSTTNFVGLTTTNALIKDADGPYKNGDNTTINYGVYTDITKESGVYETQVVYTIVAENQ
jgi:hypothetical protein